MPKSQDKVCDRDCFNCKFSDCIVDEVTDEEIQAQKKRDDFHRVQNTLGADVVTENESKYQKYRDKTLAKNKEYYEKHKEYYKEYHKKYYREHKEYYSNYIKEYRKTHKRDPEQTKRYRLKALAKQKEALLNVSND